MSPFWKATNSILRNTIAVKFGEKGVVRKWLVNLLFHIVSAKERGKKIDVLDYMWQEMHSVVLENKVPIYGQYLQTLFNKKLPSTLLAAYEMTVPPYLLLPAREIAAATPPQDDVEEEAHVEPPKKKSYGLKSILQKMNCFFVEKEDKDFKAYQKAKIYSRNQRAIMTKLELPYPESSDELSEAAYKSKNRFWFGDDASSLGPYWPGNAAASSSGPADGEDDDEGHDNIE